MRQGFPCSVKGSFKPTWQTAMNAQPMCIVCGLTANSKCCALCRRCSAAACACSSKVAAVNMVTPAGHVESKFGMLGPVRVHDVRDTLPEYILYGQRLLRKRYGSFIALKIV